MPVVMASAEPDIVATRMTGPAVSAQPNDAVAGDMDQVVEIQQQRPDRDHDGRQHPVGVAKRDDDHGQHEGGNQLDDRGESHRPLDPPGLRAGRAGAVPAVTLIA